MLANKLWFLFLVFFVFLSLRASSPGRSGGGAGKGRRVWNYDSTSNSPVARRLSCQRGVETSANVNKHWKTRGYNLITRVTSANQLCFPRNANLIQYHQSPIKEKGLERPRTNRTFASSKTSHEATSKTFLVKMSFNCMGLKNTHFHVNLASLFWNKHPTCSKSVVAFYLGLCFPSPYSRNKAKLNVSRAWWPLSGGDNNNERALIGTAKRWRRSVSRGLQGLKFPFFSTVISGLWLLAAL